jgi:hypothetical protein
MNNMTFLTITTADYDSPIDTGYMMAVITITVLILIIVFLYIILRHKNNKV